MVDQMAIIEEYLHRASRSNVISLKTIEIFLLIILPTIHQTILPMVVDRECTMQTEFEVATQGVEDLGNRHPLVEGEVREVLIKIIVISVEGPRGLVIIKGGGNRVLKITRVTNGIFAKVQGKKRHPNRQSQKHHNPQFKTHLFPQR